MSTVPEYTVPDSAVGGKTSKHRFGCRKCDESGEAQFLSPVTTAGGTTRFLSPPVYDTTDDARAAAQRHQVNVHGADRPYAFG